MFDNAKRAGYIKIMDSATQTRSKTMKISEKALLDGYYTITNGGDYVSRVRGKDIYWNYRTGRTEDGYNSVTNREKATEISLDYDKDGFVKMTSKWDNHKSIKKIESDEAKLGGNEI